MRWLSVFWWMFSSFHTYGWAHSFIYHLWNYLHSLNFQYSSHLLITHLPEIVVIILHTWLKIHTSCYFFINNFFIFFFLVFCLCCLFFCSLNHQIYFTERKENGEQKKIILASLSRSRDYKHNNKLIRKKINIRARTTRKSSQIRCILVFLNVVLLFSLHNISRKKGGLINHRKMIFFVDWNWFSRFSIYCVFEN